MKRLTIFVLAITAALFTGTEAILAQYIKYLGSVRLSYAENDIDIVKVYDKCLDRERDGFDGIRIEAKQGFADIKKVRVTYQNGDLDYLEVREDFQPGSNSRWIYLEGGRRCIDSIAILGDTDNRSPNPAIIEVFAGRQDRNY